MPRTCLVATQDKVPVCKAVVYTSNGNSCKQMLEAVPQLKGLKIITPYDKEKGDVLTRARARARTQTTDPKPSPNPNQVTCLSSA